MWYVELNDAIIILVIVVVLIIGAAIGLHFIWKHYYDKKMRAKFNEKPTEMKIHIRVEFGDVVKKD